MKDPYISIIIPFYNQDKFIRETLDSVLGQTFNNFEVLLIDDGSSDRTLEIIAEEYKLEKRIHFYYQNHQGVSVARNFGILQSKGSLLSFLDADDVWLPNHLISKIPKVESGLFGLVHSDGQLIDENSNIIHGILSGKEGMLLNDILEMKNTQIPGPSSILMHRKILEDVGHFDTCLSTSADQDFFIRIAAKYRIGRVPLTTWRYRIHSNNMHKNIEVMEKDMMYVFQKASENNFFENERFRRKCYANMFSILAASWFGDGRNIYKAVYFIFKSLLSNPLILINKIIKKDLLVI